MTAALGRRDRKKLATRKALAGAALSLVAERGFDHVTIEDIVEAVDVSSRTFFNYFASKEDAIVGADPDQGDRLRDALAARPLDEAPLETLRAVLWELTEARLEEREEWLLRLRVIRETPALLVRQLASFAAFERVLANAVAVRTGTDAERDIYPAIAAAAAVAAMRVALRVWQSNGQARPLRDLFDEALGELAHGLVAPPPTKARRK